MKLTRQLFIMAILVTAGCSPRPKAETAAGSYYTCSMHPQIHEEQPGTCPICHMDLILVKSTQTAADEISLNDAQIELGNIVADTILQGQLKQQIILTATVNADQTRRTNIAAKVKGRIDRLYVRNAGDFVKKGQPLYAIYSEELNNSKQEYRSAIERKAKLDSGIIDFDRLIESARMRLQLWGMTDAQIAELASSQPTSLLTTYYSPATGYVEDLPILEGQYVEEGSMIAGIIDLSTLWVEAQVYASQLPYIHNQDQVAISFPDLPGKKLEGRISFVNPEINSGSRIELARVVIPGDEALQPGMPAYLTVTSKENKSLMLPSDAVLRDQEGAVVWVRTDSNLFKRKKVETGIDDGVQVAINSGLQDNDVVVLSGAYLLNSEFIFKKGASTKE